MSTIITTLTPLLENLDRKDTLEGNGKDEIIILHMLLDTGEEGLADTRVVVEEQETFHKLSTEKSCTIVIHPTDH